MVNSSVLMYAAFNLKSNVLQYLKMQWQSIENNENYLDILR